MKPRARSSVLLAAAPFRAYVQRFAFLILVFAAFGLMLLGKAETLVVERVSTSVIDFVAPIMDVMSRPAASLNQAVETVRELAALRTENQELRRRNDRLRAWQEAARRLAEQNASLRAMLDYVPDPPMRFVSARVIGDPGSAFVRSMLINAGTRDGIAKGQAVVTGDGLAGRIVAAGGRSARVLMITDINSRVPVVVESSRERAILAGDNRDTMRLVFLPANAVVSPGDRILTSGHGGVFPPGLLVGRVVSVGDGGIRVRPVVPLDRLEFVRAIDYPGISAVLPDGGEAKRVKRH